MKMAPLPRREGTALAEKACELGEERDQKKIDCNKIEERQGPVGKAIVQNSLYLFQMESRLIICSLEGAIHILCHQNFGIFESSPWSSFKTDSY